MAGRPLIVIDRDDFEELCGIQCTLREIAAFLKCSDKTVVRWCKRTYGKTFDEAFEEFSRSGYVSLRRIQWRAALGGDRTMMIWLGKQHLAQTDTHKLEHTGKDGAPIQTAGVVLYIPANGRDVSS